VRGRGRGRDLLLEDAGHLSVASDLVGHLLLVALLVPFLVLLLRLREREKELVTSPSRYTPPYSALYRGM